MSDLISREALLEAHQDLVAFGTDTTFAVRNLITNAPTVQREVTVFFEDDDKTVLCFEQYKPEHIVVVLDYAKGEFVQVLRPNADGTTSSKMYEVAPVQRDGWVSVPIEPTQDMCQQGQWKANEWKQFPLRITSIYKAMIQAAPTAV